MLTSHDQKLRLMAKIEEKTNRKLWMHNTGYTEYFADKATGDVVYVLSDDIDEEYILNLVALSSFS